MFAGFTSRWTTRFRCAYANPRAASRRIESARSRESAARERRLCSVSPLDVLHDEVGASLALAPVDHLDDVRMAEASQDPRLLLEEPNPSRCARAAPGEGSSPPPVGPERPAPPPRTLGRTRPAPGVSPGAAPESARREATLPAASRTSSLWRYPAWSTPRTALRPSPGRLESFRNGPLEGAPPSSVGRR